jgi:hypothetical protein
MNSSIRKQNYYHNVKLSIVFIIKKAKCQIFVKSKMRINAFILNII